jgi:hypothetical protein
MDETRLRTIAQLQEFLAATPEVSFTKPVGRFCRNNGLELMQPPELAADQKAKL